VGNGLDIPASESQSASSDSGSDSCDSYSSGYNLSVKEEDYTSAPGVIEKTCYTEYFKLPKHFKKVQETVNRSTRSSGPAGHQTNE